MIVRKIKTLFALLCFVFLYGTDLNAQIKIKAVGDIMLGSVTPKEVLPPRKGLEFIESVEDMLMNADIVFGNLEGSFFKEGMEPDKCSDRSRKAATCYEFGMPEYLAPTLKDLGFNVLNQDNNHSADYGEDGYLFTQEVLRELGIKYIAKRSIAIFNFMNKSVVLAAFGYSEYSHHISNIDSAKQIISSLDKKYDIVIVSFHGGAEGKNATVVKDSVEIYLEENRGNVLAFSHAVIDAGADLVLGHGPHVLRAMEIYKNKLIAYSLGNFLTYGNMNVSGINSINIILEVTLDNSNSDFRTGKMIPIKQIGYGIPRYDKSLEGIKLITDFSIRDFPSDELLFFKSGLIINSGRLYSVARLDDQSEKKIVIPDSMRELNLSKYNNPVIKE